MHGVARSRRARDLALFAGIGLGVLLSLLPVLLFAVGVPGLSGVRRALLSHDLFALSPFAWGLRAAIYAGRGQTLAFLAYAGAAVAALAVATSVSALLLQRVHRGEVDLGGPVAGVQAGPARMLLPDALGALLEKDLRMAWRDPALKATLLLGMAGPALFLFFVFQTTGAARFGRGLFVGAVFVGASVFSGNAFGLERRGIGLLMSLPTDRWRILVAKNAVTVLIRSPALLVLCGAGLLIAPAYVPAALAAGVCAMLLSAGVDNYFSILFPVALPEPGQSPSGRRRGLGAAVLGAVLFMGTLALASPFVFLAWLPVLLGTPLLWLATLPLALAGAAAVYAMLVAGAARVLERREPEVLERMLSSAAEL
jgi:hypothetical protein